MSGIIPKLLNLTFLSSILICDVNSYKTLVNQLIIYKKVYQKTDFSKKVVNFAFKFLDDHIIWQKKKNSFKAKSL